jgi:hypothetical protein
VEKIARSVLSIAAVTKFKNEAILNATQLNLPISSSRPCGGTAQYRQINKLKPWLDKIRNFRGNLGLKMKNDCDSDDYDDDSDEEEKNKEMKKVKLLKISKQKIKVSGTEYLRQ